MWLENKLHVHRIPYSTQGFGEGCHSNFSADLLQLISLLKQCCQILWYKLKQFTIDILTILQGMMNIIRMSVKSNHIIITKYCQYNLSLHMVFKNRVKLYIRKCIWCILNKKGKWHKSPHGVYSTCLKLRSTLCAGINGYSSPLTSWCHLIFPCINGPAVLDNYYKKRRCQKPF